MVFTMVLMLAFSPHDKISASRYAWQGPQRGFLLPSGQYEEFYCNCWFYAPQCANVCKNYNTHYGNVIGSKPRPMQMKAPNFNPNTMRHLGLGASLNNHTVDTMRQNDVYLAYSPTRHLNIETIISNERLGKRTPSAQRQKNVAKKSILPVGVYTEQVLARNTYPEKYPRFSIKNNRNTTIENDRRICDFLVWIHLAGSNSTDRRQKALLKGVLNHFFKSNNLREIVCEANREALAKNEKDIYNGLYALTKSPYMHVFSQRTSILVASDNLSGASASPIASRVLYSKKYYTTTITPITTIVTSLDETNSKKSTGDPWVNRKESCTSTMSRADIKQDALVIAGKVQERRSKIENMLNLAHVGDKAAEEMSPLANTRSKYRTTFVWKTITPYITKEVLKYPQTAYYTTTELFTITPLTTIFVDDVNGDLGYKVSEPYISSNYISGYGTALAQNYIAAGDTFSNPYERETLATQAELPYVKKYRNINIDLNNQGEFIQKAAIEQPKRQKNIDAIIESYKSDGRPGLPVVEHNRIGSVALPAHELQKNNGTGKDASQPSSVTIKSVIESASSLKDIQSLYLDSSLMQKLSTIGSIQGEAITHSSLLQLLSLTQPASMGVKSTMDEGSLHDITTDTSTTTLVVTTTIILDLEKILEGQARSIIHREKMLDKGEGQNGSHVHDDDSVDVSKGTKADDNGSVGEKKEDTETESTYSKKQTTMSLEHTIHDVCEKSKSLNIALTTTGTLEHTKYSKDAIICTSVSQIPDTSLSTENMTSTITIKGKNSVDGRNDAGLNNQKDDIQKKAVTEIFTILTEGEGHSRCTELTTSYLGTKNKEERTAYMHSSKHVPYFTKELTSQESELMSQHTHLMDIPLVSAIVHEINAVNLSKTTDVTTTTTTYCAEYALASILERKPGKNLGKQIPEQHVYKSRGDDFVIKNAQAASSVTDKYSPSILLTIKDMISNGAGDSIFTRHTVKSVASEQINVIDVAQKSDVYTRLDSNSSGVLKSESRGDNNTSCIFSSKMYLSEASMNKTVSTFPIVKKVAIDDNFGVEIKVEPI